MASVFTAFTLFYYFSLSIPQRLRSTLFPYTTLFRSLKRLRLMEGRGSAALLAGEGLLCGLYANELLTRTLPRSEEHTSELQSRGHLVCRLLLEKKKTSANEYQVMSESIHTE